MNILISTIFWGKEYFNDFVDYSLPSLLSENNIPAVSINNSVTVVILTSESLIDEFKSHHVYKGSFESVNYEFSSLEECGFNPTRVPSGYHPKKYQFLSVCQNIVINLSKTYDLHIFNYADFVWSDGSLTNIISKFQTNNIEILLGFCIPVDGKKVREKLSFPIELSFHQAVNLALDNLHRETKLRNWNNAFISESPSYLYWEVPNEGVVVRAFHQTVLAVVPNHGGESYNDGIKHGTLDSSFASEISAERKTIIASDSNDIFIFSLYETIANSKTTHKNKIKILRSFVKTRLTKQHLANFQIAILLKKVERTDKELWEEAVSTSLKDIDFINEQILSSYAQSNTMNIEILDSWQNPKKQEYICSYLSNLWIPCLRNFVKNVNKEIIRFLSLFS